LSELGALATWCFVRTGSGSDLVLCQNGSASDLVSVGRIYNPVATARGSDSSHEATTNGSSLAFEDVGGN
jgi:hypothetical protein